jgi:hypothetical protein
MLRLALYLVVSPLVCVCNTLSNLDSQKNYSPLRSGGINNFLYRNLTGITFYYHLHFINFLIRPLGHGERNKFAGRTHGQTHGRTES